jgi:hypothetical protein
MITTQNNLQLTMEKNASDRNLGYTLLSQFLSKKKKDLANI